MRKLSLIVLVLLLSSCNNGEITNKSSQSVTEEKPVNYLLITSQQDDNPFEISFIATQNLQECEDKAKRAIAVFPSANIKYINHHCLYSDIEFTQFGHGQEVENNNYFALNISKNGRVLESVRRFDSLQECQKTGKGKCLVSSQDIKKSEY